ncbi:DUF389 domain-containing protein [Vogesella oryzae]|uniref:DUF389 domain-containing protein n=1 Tax=Vogesella oryzae TaxID=1735285 RepID=UPI001582BD83|nr:DUF389 domain-containing protein [Vogesella oryzae]
MRKRLFLYELNKLFDLRSDMDTAEEIENSITQGIHIRGTNLWILMFAIFVASIGLNVNSTAVIIGAMLISPLMGPIMGIGYGAGVDNFELIRRSARTLGVFVLLSLLTSTLYFLLTPLTQAQSELLARTAPTLWDVLIALFGGMAGIIGVTRREWGNVIPGVAIATALMPPLCTAGYGIATAQPAFFFGAFYLFTINAVYIALSALFFTRLMRLPRMSFASPASQRKARILISSALIITLVPSVYLAVQLVRNELFKTEASAYLSAISHSEKDLLLIQKDIDAGQRRITLVVAGKSGDKAQIERLQAQLGRFRLQDAQLQIRTFQQDNGADLNQLKSQLQQDLYRNSLQLLEAKNSRIQQLEQQLAQQQQHQQQLADKNAARQAEFAQLRKELLAQYPEFRQVYLTSGHDGRPDASAGSGQPPEVLIVYVETRRALNRDTVDRIRHWLMARFDSQQVIVLGKRG